MASLPTRRSFLTAGALALAARPASPQQSPVFSSDVKVTNILATVRTKSGGIVANLTKDDFLLSEDNRPQTIQYFSRETDLPLILGLLIDTSGSQRNVLREEETASARFIDRVLRDGIDKTFLVNFDYRQKLLEGLTAWKDNLRNALNNITLPDHDGDTALYDAVYVAVNEVMKKQSGRKAIILLTDGLDHGSHITLAEAIEHAQQADTLIYSILFAGEERPRAGRSPFGPGGVLNLEGDQVLQKMSVETGGGFFAVSRSTSIDTIYQRIEEELRSQYNIGYSPDPPPQTTAYRTVDLKTRQKTLIVQARKGYYPRVD